MGIKNNKNNKNKDKNVSAISHAVFEWLRFPGAAFSADKRRTLSLKLAGHLRKLFSK